MKYFDALYTLAEVGNPDNCRYHVITISAESKESASRKAKRQSRFLFADAGTTFYIARFWMVAPAGDLDHFVGMYIGEFIEKAFPKNEA